MKRHSVAEVWMNLKGRNGSTIVLTTGRLGGDPSVDYLSIGDHLTDGERRWRITGFGNAAYGRTGEILFAETDPPAVGSVLTRETGG